MPLNFVFGCIKPKVKKTVKTKNKSNKPKKVRTKIIHKDVEASVSISTSASSLRGGLFPYYDAIVMVGNRVIIVPIDDTGYDCHNVKIVYRYLNGKYITNIRDSNDFSLGLNASYTPVKPGSKVKGNVIEISNKLFFKIKKILK